MTVESVNVSDVAKKSVKFADDVGLNLAEVHEILEQDNIFFLNTSNNKLKSNGSVRRSSQVGRLKVIQPLFRLTPEDNDEKLATNGICLESLKIYNHSTIQGLILTMPVAVPASSNSRSNSLVGANGDEIDLGLEKKKNGKAALFKGFSKLLKMSTSVKDAVSVVWTVDEWKTWRCEAAKALKNAANVTPFEDELVAAHEFVIGDLEAVLEAGQKLQLVVCHKADGKSGGGHVAAESQVCYEFKCEFNT